MLLHLLHVEEGHRRCGRLLRALNQHAPILGDGQLAIEGRWLVAGVNLDGDKEFTVSFATEDAVGRGDIGIVAAHCSADVTMMCDEIVGGIEADPAQMGNERFNPCMGRVWG